MLDTSTRLTLVRIFRNTRLCGAGEKGAGSPSSQHEEEGAEEEEAEEEEEEYEVDKEEK